MTEKYVEKLRELSFLADARPEVLERLAREVTERTVAPGEIIIEEGSTGRDMYYIVEGRVEVSKEHHGEVTSLGERLAGDLVGEMAFVEDRPRFATVRALVPTTLLELSEQGMRSALARQPELLYRTVQVLSARLRAADSQMITDLWQKNEELARAYRELQEAQAALVEKERMEHELELAHDIQHSMLPQACVRLPKFHCEARYQAARQVGGDFYDVFPLGEQHVGLVMADVSDKGVAAALFMALTRSLIRAEARHMDSPRRTLLRVNRILLEISRANMFVTVFYGVLDLARGVLRYARAGHDYPLLYRSQTGECDFLAGKGMLLGFLDEIVLEEVRVDLVPGDVLVLYTDGITEAHAPDGEFFGPERLRQALLAALGSMEAGVQAATPNGTPRALAVQGICDAIAEQVDHFQQDAEQHDDMALLVVAMGAAG